MIPFHEILLIDHKMLRILTNVEIALEYFFNECHIINQHQCH